MWMPHSRLISSSTPGGEVPGEGPHRAAVDGRRVQQPARPLVALLHRRRLAQVGAYLADKPEKALDLREQCEISW
jgi:hypothetical protein